MVAFHWIFILGFLSYTASADDDSNNKIIQFLYQRCRSHITNAGDYDTIQARLKDFLSYFKYTTNLIPNGKQQFCIDEKPRLAHNMEILSKDLKKCFTEKENYLPAALSNSFTAFLNFLCDNYGRNMDDIFSTLGKECLMKMSAQNATTDVATCFNGIRPDSVYVSKSTLCHDDLKVAKKCFGAAIQRYCGDFPSFQRLNSDFFYRMQKACYNFSTSLTANAVLLVAALLSAKVFY